MLKSIIKNKTGKIALVQIVVLVIAIFAFAWMVGSSFGNVSAVENDEGGNEDTCTAMGGTCKVECGSEENWVGGSGICESEGTNYKCCVTNENSEGDNEEGGDNNENNDDGDNYWENVGTGFGSGFGGTAVGNAAANLLKKNAGKALTNAGDKGPGFFSKLWNPGTAVGTIASGVLWAAATSGLIIWLSSYYASDRNLADITTITLIGAGVGTIAVTIAVIAGATGPIGWIAGAVTALFYGVYMLVGYQIYSRETFTFYPRLWQPILGGDECNKCNIDNVLPNGENGCSEYMCHSYGQACEWINDETNYETCIEINPNDRNPPIISPLEIAYEQNVFPNNDYEYQTSDAGARIIYDESKGGECVPAFTTITLAVGTNENAYCKIGLEGYTGSDYETHFEQMWDMAEGNINTKEHILTLPSSVTASESAMEEAGFKLNNGGNFEFYIRCQDVQGNINPVDYIMEFCVQEGPDTWDPEIIGTSPAENSYLKEGTLTIPDFQVYTNEPADCKWDFEAKSYDAMDYEFDTCSQSLNEPIRGAYVLGCEGNLTGFKDGVVNKYYITCVDQPELKGTEDENKRNEMSPYEVDLIGTNSLVISDVKINDEENGTIIRDSRNNINVELKVQTFGGAEEGKARCRYSSDGINYGLFSNGGSRDYLVTNTHNLYLSEGNYSYFIQCEDIANNFDTTYIEFSVETDTEPPEVLRWFRDGNYLRIITNEKGNCVYSNDADLGCTYYFDDGIAMIAESGEFDTNHYADWPENSQTTYYIKCKDQYGKGPATNECTTIVRPFEIPDLRS